jgi:hypothetical protein
MHSVGPLPQKRLVGELLGNQSRLCSCPAVSGVVGVLPHGALHSKQACP